MLRSSKWTRILGLSPLGCRFEFDTEYHHLLLKSLDINAACKLANLSEKKISNNKYHCEFTYPEYEGLVVTFYDLQPVDIVTPYRYHLKIECKSFHLLFVVEEDLFSIGREEDTPLILPEDVMMLDEISREELIFDDVDSDLLFLKMFIG